jgi:CheY-like chemotaxis protein
MKVLLVDDEHDARLIGMLSLSRVGRMEVLEATNGPAAIATATAETPDVILLDVMMPGMDGPATLRILRATPSTARIPVIFLTAKALKGEQQGLIALGVRGILVKPFNPMTLAEEVRELMAAC